MALFKTSSGDVLHLYDENNCIIDSVYTESDEQLLVLKYIHETDCVLELGGRYGSVSRCIQSVLQDKSQHLIVEPDERVWKALEQNMLNHGFSPIIFEGFISNKPLKLSNLESGYGATSEPSDNNNCAQHTSLKNIIDITGLNFTALVADCEGFLETFFRENEWFVKQLRIVIFEKDYCEKCDYEYVIKLLYDNNFMHVYVGSQNVYIRVDNDDNSIVSQNNKSILNVYYNGFWDGFFDKTNPVNVSFFDDLMKKVYNVESINHSTFCSSDILIENVHAEKSLLEYKNWKHSFFYSGESTTTNNEDLYSCVLFGRNSAKNVVNVPLYIPYLYSSFGSLPVPNKRCDIPQKEVIAIITNPNGTVRNAFLTELEKHMNVTYAGKYKNNTGYTLDCPYNSSELFNEISNYKFVITMENSIEETYITEKILHGVLANVVPVYWGSPNVSTYFSEHRFIHLKNQDETDNVINIMKNMTDSEWLSCVNSEPFTELGKNYWIDEIASDIKAVIESQK
jgi:hypothetical protein